MLYFFLQNIETASFIIAEISTDSEYINNKLKWCHLKVLWMITFVIKQYFQY